MPGRLCSIVAYRGSGYCGWQVQPGQKSIQGLLQDAYRRMTGLDTTMVAASRTDAGVHAEGQLVCFDNPSRHPPEVLLEGLNHYLPADVAILTLHPVAANFDPRRRAVGKHYRYVIWNQRVRPVFSREFCWHLRQPLDLTAMTKASHRLVGEHDFSSFRGSGCTARNPVRRLDALAWQRDGPFVICHAWGRSFLKQMVRNLVGSLVEVGRGRLAAQEISEILRSRDRRRAGATAPAQGLCLVRVYLDHRQYWKDMRAINRNLPTWPGGFSRSASKTKDLQENNRKRRWSASSTIFTAATQRLWPGWEILDEKSA